MEDLVQRISDRSARGIANAVAAEINQGTLGVGARLPTVRALAHDLGVSATTVAQAWSQLSRAGLVEGRGKAGTRVRAAGLLQPASRYAALAHPVGSAVDLSLGIPDEALLPDVRRSMRRLTRTAATSSYFDSTIIPELETVLRSSWPFAPEALTVVDGAVDAMSRAINVCVAFGSVVLVENPTFPPILDLLDARGAKTIGLPVDDEGVCPDALERALMHNPVMLVLQPRAQNPRGHSMSARRVSRLSELLSPHETVILEDDHAAYISGAPEISLGCSLPGRTVLVRSFSKSHGPDLRLAAVGGAGRIIEEIIRARQLGPGWSSQLLQALLHDMLIDAQAQQAVATARETYQARRDALAVALKERDVIVEGADGINMWVQVAEERSALMSLGLQGIDAARGSPFEVSPLPSHHLRLTYAALRSDFERVADAIAAAAQRPARRATR